MVRASGLSIFGKMKPRDCVLFVWEHNLTGPAHAVLWRMLSCAVRPRLTCGLGFQRFQANGFGLGAGANAAVQPFAAIQTHAAAATQ